MPQETLAVEQKLHPTVIQELEAITGNLETKFPFDVTSIVKSIVDTFSLEWLNRQLNFCLHGYHVAVQGESLMLVKN